MNARTQNTLSLLCPLIPPKLPDEAEQMLRAEYPDKFTRYRARLLYAVVEGAVIEILREQSQN